MKTDYLFEVLVRVKANDDTVHWLHYIDLTGEQLQHFQALLLLGCFISLHVDRQGPWNA